jgi:hypothetical protein
MEGSAFLTLRIAVRKLLLNIMSSLCLFQEAANRFYSYNLFENGIPLKIGAVTYKSIAC